MSIDIGTIIASIIGVAGVIITAIVSLYVARKTSYSNNVTKERAIWLQNFREEINSFFAGVSIANLKKDNMDSCCEIISKAEGAKAAIISRLRNNELDNVSAKRILNEINFNENKINTEYIDELRIILNRILEREWDKTKEESSMFSKGKGAIIFVILLIVWLVWGVAYIFASTFSSYTNNECFRIIVVIWAVGIVIHLGLLLYSLIANNRSDGNSKGEKIIEECVVKELDNFYKSKSDKFEVDINTGSDKNIIFSISRNSTKENNTSTPNKV